MSGPRLLALIVSLLALSFALGCRGIAASPVQNGVQLAVSMSGNGSGTITSSPAGINCPTACSANFPSGTQVMLTATLGNSSTFAGWGGACSGTSTTCTITLTATQNVTAGFTAIQAGNYQLTVTDTTSGSASGSVTSSPSGINCPGTCSANFPSSTAVTLTETSGPACNFLHVRRLERRLHRHDRNL